MANLNEIRRSETDVGYWRDKTMYWWRRYQSNVKLIAELRRQNRQIRLLLSDYVADESADFDDQSDDKTEPNS